MPTEHFDVLIVGAGISGIGAAYHLNTMCPTRTYAILEGRDDIGGTWDLFRYPGVRSDSDMHTLGFSFKPWTSEKSIADGPSILEYLRQTVDENGIAQRIRFGHHVTRAEWSTPQARWTLTVERRGTNEPFALSCNYLFMCSGYYSYKAPYEPQLPGLDRFRGRVVHPQTWPDDLDFEGRRVVVIGSGATAMTIVPEMAKTARHVTMLQRSPTWVIARSDTDAVANRLRKILPSKAAYAVTRRKNTAMQQVLYKRTRTRPAQIRTLLLKQVRKQLGPDYDVDRHFTPTYNPWDQRMCLLPNGDLFRALRHGTASIVTDHIDTITEGGIILASGAELDADIIVTATGLQLVTLGEMDFVVDGQPVDFSTTWTYKGLAYSDVPNLASSFGYINASWTLRSDLIAAYVCRLLNHMAATGAAECTPRLRPSDRSMPARPWITAFTPGYMNREMHRFPRQGDREPWINPQNYRRDKAMFRKGAIDDGVMTFTPRLPAASAPMSPPA